MVRRRKNNNNNIDLRPYAIVKMCTIINTITQRVNLNLKKFTFLSQTKIHVLNETFNIERSIASVI